MIAATDVREEGEGARDAQRASLTMERTFAAPRGLVWLAWTKPAMAVQWFGPVEWPAVEITQDLRVGGRWKARLKACDSDATLVLGGVYRRVDEPSLLEFTFKWGDGHVDGEPVETLVSLDFIAIAEDRTHVRFRQSGLKSDASASGHHYGWTSAFQRLEILLSTHEWGGAAASAGLRARAGRPRR